MILNANEPNHANDAKITHDPDQAPRLQTRQPYFVRSTKVRLGWWDAGALDGCPARAPTFNPAGKETLTTMRCLPAALGVDKPPDLEYILVYPFAIVPLPFGYGFSYNSCVTKRRRGLDRLLVDCRGVDWMRFRLRASFACWRCLHGGDQTRDHKLEKYQACHHTMARPPPPSPHPTSWAATATRRCGTRCHRPGRRL